MEKKTVEELQISALKKETIIQRWKLKNLEMKNANLKHKREILSLKQKKLELQIKTMENFSEEQF